MFTYDTAWFVNNVLTECKQLFGCIVVCECLAEFSKSYIPV